jgi:hypothetical protein
MQQHRFLSAFIQQQNCMMMMPTLGTWASGALIDRKVITHLSFCRPPREMQLAA